MSTPIARVAAYIAARHVDLDDSIDIAAVSAGTPYRPGVVAELLASDIAAVLERLRETCPSHMSCEACGAALCEECGIGDVAACASGVHCGGEPECWGSCSECVADEAAEHVGGRF